MNNEHIHQTPLAVIPNRALSDIKAILVFCLFKKVKGGGCVPREGGGC